jgi:hypothetical protein
MQVIKGIYKNGKVELIESLDSIQSADLYIVVIPHKGDKINQGDAKHISINKCTQSEEEFKQMGLAHFFDTNDDINVDWEEVFGLENR